MLTADIPLALTFDDVLLVPAHSTVLPDEVNVSTAIFFRRRKADFPAWMTTIVAGLMKVSIDL